MSTRYSFDFGHNPVRQTAFPFLKLPDPRAPRDMDGETYEAKEDKVRLNKQLQKVWQVMKCGRWYSLAEIARLADCPQASASARLRDLRKAKFGGHAVERKRVKGGQFLYRVNI